MTPPRRATIMLVEDDQLTALTLAEALESDGYRVHIATSGGEARDVLIQVQPDLIIMDLMLPDADGLGLTITLKSMTSAPIIICSARQGQVDRALGSRLGAIDFVSKPVDLDDLQARVEAALS
jgi:DNA-binding response OmpR family regulator